MSNPRRHAPPRAGLWLAALATTFAVGGAAATGCRAREFTPEQQRALATRRAEVRSQGPADPRAAHIGPFGYQPDGLLPGNTGGGTLVSAGLRPRGGGPVTNQDCDPRGLAVGEHIGTPQNDGAERVVVDPVTDEPVLYSQRHHDVAPRFQACGLENAPSVTR